jgi:hypothetical protein
LSKAILVIDMPENCKDCDFCYYSDGRFPSCKLKLMATDDCMEKPDWCPLKQMPQHKNSYTCSEEFLEWCHIGYNECIDEILGGST